MWNVFGFCLLVSVLEISLKVSFLKQARQKFQGCSLFDRKTNKQTNTNERLPNFFSSPTYTKQNQGYVILTVFFMLSTLFSVIFSQNALLMAQSFLLFPMLIATFLHTQQAYLI